MNADAVTMPPITDAAPRKGEPEEHEGEREAAPYGSFAEKLLHSEEATEESWGRELGRLGVGLGLAGLFGASLGLRVGGAAIASHALGVAAGLTAVAAVASPAFAIVLALVNAPVSGHSLARATAGAVARAGLLLGGLAPAAALYVVTVEDAITVTIVGFGALLLAGIIGATSFAQELRAPLEAASRETQRWMTFAMPAFLLFAALLAARVWWLALPVLTGVR